MVNTQLKSRLAQLRNNVRSQRNVVPASHQLFDASKMQYETARHQKRRKLLLWSLPVVVLVFFVGLWFFLPTPLTYKAIGNYDRTHYRTARDWLTPLTWTSPQQFVIAFNSGTVDTMLGSYTRAQAELTHALALAPTNKRCMVLQNLVYSLNAHANSLEQQANQEGAADYTAQSMSIKSQNPKCFPVIPPKKIPPGGGGGGGGGGGSISQPEEVLSQAQADELEQKDEEGQQSEQQAFGQHTLNPNSPDVKPW